MRDARNDWIRQSRVIPTQIENWDRVEALRERLGLEFHQLLPAVVDIAYEVVFDTDQC